MPAPKLTDKEVAQRVAILKRFRALLDEQRTKFRDYLSVLEKQETMISEGNVDAIVQHTELEQGIISEIYTIQKVIDPLETMYRAAHPEQHDNEIPKLKTDLEKLRKDVLLQNEKNRELLKSHMQLLRQKVSSLKNPYANRSSVYASDAHTASLIDINQ
ncbi:MAG TPA: flagellar biosynthesis protein FlgN [Treponema sp.]|nr:flagellar biosynthesis protein FlgN [Treponema sp.]